MDGYFSGGGGGMGESLQKPFRQTNFRRGYICRVPYVHRYQWHARVYAYVVVVRILRSNATARHHICRNIRLVHTGEIRFTVGARMQVPRASLAHRRESHTPPATCKYSQYFFLRYSNCERARSPAVPCAKCNDVRSDVRRILRIRV